MGRKFRHNGSTNTKIERGKHYKYDSTGNITEITGTVDMTSDDIIFTGTKSNLRRIADLERKLNTAQFNMDQLRVGRDAFVNILTAKLAEEEKEAA